MPTTVNAGARLDRLPISSFHYRIFWLIGAGMFFDGYDLYVASGVLAGTVQTKFATPPQVFQFISWTFVGMTIGSVLALCGIVTCVAAIPIIREYGSTVDAPDQLPGGLTLSTNADRQSTVEDLKTELKSSFSSDTVVAGYYDASGDTGHPVLFAAAATLVLLPGTQLDDAFRSLDSELPVTGVTSYDAGTFGGSLKCGSSTSSGIKLSLCIWADYGTVGIGAFFARDVAESAALFKQIREATEHR